MTLPLPSIIGWKGFFVPVPAATMKKPGMVETMPGGISTGDADQALGTRMGMESSHLVSVNMRLFDPSAFMI